MRSKGHYLLWTVFITIVAHVAAYGYSSHLCNKTVEEEYTVKVPYDRRINDAFHKLKLAAPSYTMHKTKLVNKWVCCDGYERVDESSPCLRSQDPHSYKKVEHVPMQFTHHSRNLTEVLKNLKINLKPFTGYVKKKEVHNVCQEGYEKENGNGPCKWKLNIPKPIEKNRDESCNCGANSKCTAPFICECLEGFYLVNGVCVPEPLMTEEEEEKEFDRLNSILCDLNDELLTDDDDEAIPQYTQKDVGNQQQVALPKKKVGPKCTRDCPAHSTCIADELCRCDEGYSDLSGSCQPLCYGEPIEHSRCARPGEWECDDGYFKSPSNQGHGFSCEPHCSQGCPIYAECVAPNVCDCLPGYEKSKLQGEIAGTEVEICSPSSQDDQIQWNSGWAIAKQNNIKNTVRPYTSV